MTTNQTIDGVSLHWADIEAAVWGAFADGKHDYKGCTRERLRELRIQQGAPAYPNRICHIDYTAHPYICGCLKGDEEAQRRYDEKFGKPAAQPQGEPVAWLFESPRNLEPVRSFTRDKAEAEQYKRVGWVVTPVYASLPAPAMPQCEDCNDTDLVMQLDNSVVPCATRGCTAGDVYRAYDAQNVPVPVALPERREIGPNYPYLSGLDIEWNACLDEVAHLNTKE